jgi:hypothetical protein
MVTLQQVFSGSPVHPVFPVMAYLCAATGSAARQSRPASRTGASEPAKLKKLLVKDEKA